MPSTASAPHASAAGHGGAPAADIVVAYGGPDDPPALRVQLLNPVGHPRGPPTDIPASPGATIVDPEFTPLARGGLVLTWMEAYSNGLTGHYAVLNAGGRILVEGAFGQAAANDIEAVALPDGGFALADANTDLFGLHGSILLQTFAPRGAPTGDVITVLTETSPTGGLHYSNLEGVSTGAGIELTWTEPSGAHSALVEPDGAVGSFSLLGQSHAHAQHGGGDVRGNV